MRASRAISAALLALLTSTAQACAHRSHTAKAEFQRQQPCPATGSPRGRCPGYVIDHLQALCAGGADVSANMQWQTVAEGKAKDKTECKR